MIPISILPRRRAGVVQSVPKFTTYTLSSSSNPIALLDGGVTNDWQGRNSIVDVGGGVWAMLVREAVSHTDNGTGAYHIVFSDDKGVTWSNHNEYTDGSSIAGFPYTANVSGATSSGDMIILRCPNGDLITIQLERDNATELASWKAVTQNRSTDGGLTWSYEGELTSYLDGTATQNWAQYDYTIIGNDIYLVGSDHDGDLTTAGIKLYKSSDNAQTWSKVSTIWPNDGSHYEGSIELISGTTMMSVARQDEQDKTSMKLSTDLGLSWGSSTDITSAVGGFGVHQPRLRKFQNESRIYLVGRRNLVYGSTTKNGMWYSDDSGTTWTLFVPNATDYADTGYADLIKRSESVFYMVGYEGTLAAARTKDYVIQAS